MYKPDDSERAMYIYKQRKEEKRQFADIGRELGITGQRVAVIYRRIDWQLNGLNADHRQGKTEHESEYLEVVKDPETGLYKYCVKK